MIGAATMFIGCTSTPSNDSGQATSGTASSTAQGARSSEVDASLEKLRQRLDAELLAGPSTIEALGYRTLWQTRVETAGGSRLVGSQCSPESVFVWDSLGIVTRLGPGNGTTLWQGATNSAVDKVLSVLALETSSGASRVAFVTDTQVVLVDGSNGIFVERQEFKRLASTAALPMPPHIIYGTRAGQIVWHDFEVGSATRAVQLSGQVVAAPRIAGAAIVGTSTEGSVGAFDAARGRLLWERTLNGGITTRAAADERAIWVACRDQYLTCLSLKDGRPLWRYFTQSPMDESPTLLEDALYLQLKGEGLVCFDPLPVDKFEGVVRWRSPEITGNVIGLCASGLLVWDAPSRTLTLAEAHSGAIIRRLGVPNAVDLSMTNPVNGDIVITGADGRVQRLTPIARRPAARS